MSNRSGIAFLLCAASFLLPQPSSGAELVAVNQLTPNGVTPSEAASLTDALRSELGKTGKYQVLERGQMEQILKEQGFQQSGICDEASCAIEIGKLLAVNTIVMGNIGKVGKTYTFSVRLVDVGTGKITRDITEYNKGSPDELLTKMIPLIAKKVSNTYVEKKKNNTGWWIAGGTVVAAAIVVPVVILTSKGKPSNEPTSSDVTVRWNQ